MHDSTTVRSRQSTLTPQCLISGVDAMHDPLTIRRRRGGAPWRLGAAALAMLAATSPKTVTAAPPEFMVELRLDGRSIEGMPLSADARRVRLLARDGRLWEFPPEKARDYRQTASAFQSYSISEFRAALLRELGEGFEVSGAGNYLVAHPRGRRDQWAPRFEELYRSFVHYFGVRGMRIAPPRFPLIAIVCRGRDEFQRYSARRYGDSSGVMGYYSIETNRIVLYDMGGKADSPDWRLNAQVVIHEATHQTAFNTGVHNRFAPPPLWVAEGLATMFETPGVYDARRHPRLEDRVHAERLAAFRRLARPGHRPERLRAMIAADEVFRTQPEATYAEAWALSFLLVETRPRQYVEYLARTAAREPFVAVSASDRLGDFVEMFGDDWAMLEARLLRFVDELPR